MEQKPIIRVCGLRKVYRIGDEKVVALANMNLEILQGQIICIVGTSGSGKSTLLNQLAGLEKPSRGAVYIGKTNISKLSENQLATFRQRYLGFVFQSYNLLPTMTALENVALPLIFKGIGKRKRNKAALTMLDAVGLKKRARHKPTQMSGGQQQRVGIARAFVSHPKVVFADEPTGNLDTKTTIDVMRMMVRFARKYNQTLILVTHDPEIADYADRVITLIDGEITTDIVHTPIYDGIDSVEPLPEIPSGEELPDDPAEDDMPILPDDPAGDDMPILPDDPAQDEADLPADADNKGVIKI
ncbi:ATP-binding cassette domain-containing protein [Oscillospiraceae bacterium PP1C4]